MFTKKGIIYIICFICLLLILCILTYKPMMSLSHELDNFKNLGILGYIALIGVMFIQVILVFLPGEIIEIMAGWLYGPIGGTIACMIGSAIGSGVIYIFTKKFGMKFVSQFIDVHKINEVRFLQNKNKRNILCFIVFFIPGTPKDILTYLIPLTDMKLTTFLFITTIARIPSIITSTIGGHALGIADYSFSIIVFIITGIISLIGIYIYKRLNHQSLYHL